MVGGRARCRQRGRWEVECFRYLWATAPPRLLIIRRGKLSIEMRTMLPSPFLLANHRVWLAVPLLAMALSLASCAAFQPISTTGPRSEQLYPILLTEDSHRKESIAV